MKKLFIASICLLFVSTACFADSDKPITFNELPTAARTLVQKYFPKEKVTLVKAETGLFEKNYDIIFTSGTKIEFNSGGQWTEISCKGSAVPAALIPAAIAKYVKENYANTKILGIEKDSNRFDVKLSNNLELEFDKKFRLTDIDD